MRETSWDDFPVEIRTNLGKGDREGLVRGIAWISSKLPGGIDTDVTSRLILGLWTTFAGPNGPARMMAVQNWPAYLTHASRNANHRESIDAKFLSHPHDDERLDRIADPLDVEHQVEAREMLRTLSADVPGLTPAEKEALDDLLNELVAGEPQPQATSKATRHRNAVRLYRLRRKLAAKQFKPGKP